MVCSFSCINLFSFFPKKYLTFYLQAEVKHWHGAAKDEWFQHLAVEVPAEGGANEWLEAVSDEEYKKLK